MKFASKIWKLLVGIKDALALAFLILFFGVIYAVLTARPTAGHVEKGALLLDLNGVIVEEKSEVDPLSMLLASEAPTREYQARDIERALHLAAKDDRIKVVVLDLSRFMGGRFVHLSEIGRAMDEVRKAGKPILTFANVYVDDSVQLAAHASEVWMDPMGEALVMGPGGETQYFKGLIDRFNVNAHVYRVGTYKSFVEPYIRKDMSPEAREDYRDIYGALWSAWQTDVKKARPKAQIDKLAADPLAAIKSAGGDFAQAAKAVGLVDKLGDKTEFDKHVAKLAGASSDGDLPYAHTGLATWLKANPPKTPGKGIAVVTVAGNIVDGDAGPGEAGGDRIAGLLDDNIDEGYKALVVRVDSPGGSATAAERIRRAVQRWRDAKIPVVISMGNMAASGGYWVSTRHDYRLDRGLCCDPQFREDAGRLRRDQRRGAHDAAFGPAGHSRWLHAGAERPAPVHGRGRLWQVHQSGRQGPRADARADRCDRAGPRVGRRGSAEDRTGRPDGRSRYGTRLCGEAGRTGQCQVASRVPARKARCLLQLPPGTGSRAAG